MGLEEIVPVEEAQGAWEQEVTGRVEEAWEPEVVQEAWELEEIVPVEEARGA